MKNPKAKGSEFERKVCKSLSLWISDDERDDLFWRSAMSGGRASVKFKKGENNKTQIGDISAIDPLGAKLTNKFVVECKCYQDIKLYSMLYGMPRNNSLLGFWNELVDISYANKKLPILIFKENGKQEMICLDNAGKGILIDDRYSDVPILANFPERLMSIFSFHILMKEIDHVVLDKFI